MEEIGDLLSFSDIQKQCFEVCYDSNKKGLNTKTLLEELNSLERLNGTITSSTRLYQLRTDVAKKIKNKFETEMRADIPKMVDLIDTGRPGTKPTGKAPHEVASHWLWNYKFPRWQIDWNWNSLRQKAEQNNKECNEEWIWFTEFNGNRKIVMPEPSKRKRPTVKVNTPYLMYVDLKYSGRYLLLLNRGEERYVLCPSKAVSPDWRLSGNLMVMPQVGAMLEDIRFDSPGTEELLAIVMEQDFDFPGLVTSEEKPVVVWDVSFLNQLLSMLEKQNNWRVYYRACEIVLAK